MDQYEGDTNPLCYKSIVNWERNKEQRKEGRGEEEQKTNTREQND
jgi:hypothetical protein